MGGGADGPFISTEANDVSTSTLVLTADGTASSTSNRTSFGSMVAIAAVSICLLLSEW